MIYKKFITSVQTLPAAFPQVSPHIPALRPILHRQTHMKLSALEGPTMCIFLSVDVVRYLTGAELTIRYFIYDICVT